MSYNDTMNSDKRLYESDNNATMRTLFAQRAGFLNTCADLMGRAINTVPAGVQLSEPITVMPAKPVNVTYDFSGDGKLMLSGKIRILTSAGSSSPRSLTLRVSGNETKLEPEAETGSSVFGRSGGEYGTTTYFPFSLSGPAIQNATSFYVQSSKVPEQTFWMDSQAFVVPSLTVLSGTALNVTIADWQKSSCEDFTINISAPITQRGTLTPKMSGMNMVLSEVKQERRVCTMCEGQVVLPDLPTGLVTIETFREGKLVDTLLVNGGQAGW